MDCYHVKLTFIEPLLGSVPLDKDIYRRWIATKAPVPEQAENEAETIPEVETLEQGTKGFHRFPDGTPMIRGHVIKGFFKSACGILRRDSGTLSAGLRAYKKVIDGAVWVQPKMIPIELGDGGYSLWPVSDGPKELGLKLLQRPLRCQTAQGERVALACSEIIPIGSTLEFDLLIVGGIVDEEVLREWLEYGQLRGLGEWRSSGMGEFSCQMTKVTRA